MEGTEGGKVTFRLGDPAKKPARPWDGSTSFNGEGGRATQQRREKREMRLKESREQPHPDELRSPPEKKEGKKRAGHHRKRIAHSPRSGSQFLEGELTKRKIPSTLFKENRK